MAKETKVLMLSKILSERMEEFSGEKTEIFFLVFDEKKNIVEYRRFETEDQMFFKKDLFCYAVSSLSRGEYECRVVIRNLENGRVSSACFLTAASIRCSTRSMTRRSRITFVPGMTVITARAASSITTSIYWAARSS